MAGNLGSDFSDTNSEVYDQKSITVTDAGVELVTDTITTQGLSSRQFVRVYNTGPDKVFIGPNGVTAGSGEELFKRQWMEIAVKGQVVKGITDSGKTAVVIVTDLG